MTRHETRARAGRLKFLRKRCLKWTQGKLGQELGYTALTVHKWEDGIHRIPDVVLKYLEVFVEINRQRGRKEPKKR